MKRCRKKKKRKHAHSFFFPPFDTPLKEKRTSLSLTVQNSLFFFFLQSSRGDGGDALRLASSVLHFCVLGAS